MNHVRPARVGATSSRMATLGCLVALAAVLAGGCAAPRPSLRVQPLTSAASRTDLRAALDDGMGVMALGDSVPYGTACGCTPYPQLTGAALSRVVGRHISVDNDAVPGYRSSNVLDGLEHSADVEEDVRTSGVFLIEIGANDVSFSGSCGTDSSCYLPKVPQTADNIRHIIDRLHQLTRGRPIELVLVDYWNVWLGGRYAAAQGPAYVATADALTAAVDDVIRSAAAADRSHYVDLRTLFRGPDQDEDESDLLAPDGDHPNSAGQQLIAAAVERALTT